jgi:hypothetical protein
VAELEGVIMSLAVVAVAGGGIAAVVGLKPVRDRLLGVAVVLVVAALAVPLFRNFLSIVLSGFHGGGVKEDVHDAAEARRGMSPVLLVAFLLGHGALGLTLLRRRSRGRDAARSEERELEEARGRRRPRLPEVPEESEP